MTTSPPPPRRRPKALRVPRRKKRDPEGRMSLADHLRELRNRFIVCLVAIVLTGIIGWIYYTDVLNFLQRPLYAIAERHDRSGIGLNFQGVTSAFALQLHVALWVGVILASPIWIWQIWGFIVPGLTRKEKRTAAAFICAAVPLFLAGCALGNLVMPTVMYVLIGDFTPQGSYNLVPADQYVAFTTRFILAFGLSFLLPVLLVGLNMAHVLPAHIMFKGWRVAVIVCFVFSAMMTPTPDPWTMLFMAIPLCGLYFGACGVAYLIDRRRAKDRPDWSDLPDDEASPL